ncbi:MAG TPA: protease pro-enzyme activation domain-containing protein, partial [Terriglobales bacterium]
VGPGMDYPLPPNGTNVLTNDPADPLTMSMTGTFTGQGALAGNYVYSISGYYTSPIGVTVTAYNINGVQIAQTVLAADNGASDPFSLTVSGCTGAQYSAGCVIAYVTFSDGGVPDSLTIGQLTLTDAATPEPATLAMFGTGLLGLAGAIKRRRKLGAAAKKATPAVLAILVCVCMLRGASQAATRLVTGHIDTSDRVAIMGNKRPEAIAKNDRGRVPDSLRFDHILLQLKRSPEQESALEKFMAEQQNPKSPNYHNWLTAQQLGERYGVANEDIEAIKGWLQSYGFKVNVVYTSHMVIDVSATAGQIYKALGTEIHYVDVNGQKHVANMSDPKIPAALADVIVGFVSLHDIPPQKMFRQKHKAFTTGESDFPYILVPSDLATIYNLNPLYNQGINGSGQTIVVLEDTDVYNYPGDWNTFRTAFGLAKYTQGTFVQIHPAPPTGPNNCTDPGINGDQDEAILDAQWASAVAPNAAIQLASCVAGSGFNFGGLLALQNLINESGTPPAVISMSYGESEISSGTTLIAQFNSAFQQAAAEGVSMFVSSGDANAAAQDRNANDATHGISVTGWGESVYNVSVGGTDYEDGFLGNYNQYWNPYNNVFFGSAKSYIPEIPWNGTCASLLTAEFFGYSQTYGSTGFCNASSVGTTLLSVFGGSGGPSGCATGTAATSRTVSGTCAGFQKPSWQSVFGNPSDGVRDIPDVSLFASNGIWGHYLVFCWSNTAEAADGGALCVGDPDTWAGGGGTSFSSPIMAGIQALVNENTGERWGNPNNVYYELASAEYGNSGNAACNSSASGGPASSCVFYDVTVGDMNSPCTNNNCYLPSGTNGVMSADPEALTSIALTAAGSGYSSGTTCTITGGGGSGGTCTVTVTNPSAVTAVALTTAGSGYNSTPTCAISGGGGTGATCTVAADPIGSLQLTNGGSGYTSTPTCAISGGGGTGATCTARRTGSAISSVTLSAAGSGYTSTPTCTISGGGGTGATCAATPSTAATGIKLTAAGSGFTSTPSCTISGGGGSGAVCTAAADPVASVTLTSPGGYQWLPLCTITGSGTGATCAPAASNSASGYNPAYGTNTGWDFSTGIGSVNAFNLVNQWSSVPAGQGLRRNGK